MTDEQFKVVRGWLSNIGFALFLLVCIATPLLVLALRHAAKLSHCG